MNETGGNPGQPWLWLYQLWYQLPGFRTSVNADLIAIYPDRRGHPAAVHPVHPRPA